MRALSFEESPGVAGPAVLVAACDGSHRSTLVGYLEHHGFRVVVTDCGEKAKQIALAGGIKLVVTGPVMPGLDGYALTRDLRQALPDLPVILMFAGGDRLSNTLLDCALALSEQCVYGPRPPALGAGNDLCDYSHARVAKLTPREREVLFLVAKGFRNKMIARRLSISPRTVENHRAQVMRKTDARGLADLVRLDLALGSSNA